MKIHINVDNDDFKLNGNLVSSMYCEVGENCFPDAGWTDFIVIVLNWWIEGFIKQINSQTDVEYNFMDGPFQISSKFETEDEIFLNYQERGRSGVKDLYSEKMSVSDFYKELKTVTNELLRKCHSNQYDNEDVQRLKSNFKQLSQLPFK